MANPKELLLQNHIRNMFQEGLVNNQFHIVQALKQVAWPDYALRAIVMYCQTVEKLFLNLSQNLEEPQVDFHKVGIAVTDLFLSTNCIGAEKILKACLDLLRACEDKNRERCQETLNVTKTKYCYTKHKFQTYIELEREVINDRYM